METVTVSPSYRVVIPKYVRELFGIRPGQKMQMHVAGKSLVLTPLHSVNEVRGSMPGLSTDVQREEADRV